MARRKMAARGRQLACAVGIRSCIVQHAPAGVKCMLHHAAPHLAGLPVDPGLLAFTSTSCPASSSGVGGPPCCRAIPCRRVIA